MDRTQAELYEQAKEYNHRKEMLSEEEFSAFISLKDVIVKKDCLKSESDRPETYMMGLNLLSSS